MTKLITKDELIKQLAIAEKNEQSVNDLIKEIKDGFAKVFGWKENRSQWSNDVVYRSPTWIEIFVEVGKLLSYDDRATKVEELQRLRQIVEEYRIKEEKNENK